MNTLVTQSVLGKLHFSCLIHRADTVEDLQLCPDTFYREWRKDKDLPKFPHYEVELMNMSELEVQFPDLSLHIHKSKTDTNFMCYTPDVSSVEQAHLMWKAWCVGTTYSFMKSLTTKDVHKYDFAYPFIDCKEDHQAFIDFMAQEYGITLIA